MPAAQPNPTDNDNSHQFIGMAAYIACAQEQMRREPLPWWATTLYRQAARHEYASKVELLREQRRFDARNAQEAGFSRREIARFYGCHPSTISALLRAEVSPR